MPYVDVACRLCLVTVFAVAAYGKLIGFAAFARSLRQLRVVPQRTVSVVARLSVAAEVAIVVLLVAPFALAAVAGFVLALGVLAVFSGAIALSVRRGNTAPCRCFGASSTPLGPRHLVRNALLLAVAAAGLAGVLTPGALELPGTLVAGAAGLVVGAMITVFDDIADLVKPAR